MYSWRCSNITVNKKDFTEKQMCKNLYFSVSFPEYDSIIYKISKFKDVTNSVDSPDFFLNIPVTQHDNKENLE